MIELRGFGKNRSFFVILRDFQIHLTLRQINRFFRFLSQIKALFFYFNRFLNFHKKNGFCYKKVSPRSLFEPCSLIRPQPSRASSRDYTRGAQHLSRHRSASRVCPRHVVTDEAPSTSITGAVAFVL